MTQNNKLDVLIADMAYIKGILEDNIKTGQIGTVKLAHMNKERIDRIEKNEEIRMGKIGVLGVVFGVIGANIFNIIKFLKLFL